MVVLSVFLCGVSIRRNLCVKLKKVDKGGNSDDAHPCCQTSKIINSEWRHHTEKRFSLS